METDPLTIFLSLSLPSRLSKSNRCQKINGLRRYKVSSVNVTVSDRFSKCRMPSKVELKGVLSKSKVKEKKWIPNFSEKFVLIFLGEGLIRYL